MYRQVIDQARAQAQALLNAAQDPAAAGLRDHAGDMASRILPALATLGGQATDFATSAGAQIDALVAAIGDGAMTPAALAAMHDLGLRAADLQAKAQAAQDQVQASRDALSGDVATLTARATELAAQAAGLEARQRELMDKARAIQKRIDTINALMLIPVVGPFIKLGDELASLITDHKSTEETLADTARDLAGIQMQRAQLQAAAAQAAALAQLSSQMASGAQNVATLLALIAGKLQNEQAFASGNSRPMLLTLQASLQQLQSMVS